MIDQLDRIDEYLAACQLGITMASIGIGFLGEPAVAELVEPIFGDLSHGVAVAISVAIAYALVTTLHVVVGEQAPSTSRSRGPRTALAPLRLHCGGFGVSAPPHRRAHVDVERARPALRRPLLGSQTSRPPRTSRC